MVAVKQLTKSDLIELVDKYYSDAKESETIACIISVSDGTKVPAQQALLFSKELEGEK